MWKLTKVLIVFLALTNSLSSHGQYSAHAGLLTGPYFLIKSFVAEGSGFSADMYVLITSGDGTPTTEYPSRIAMIPGAVRVELKASEMKMPRLTPDMSSSLKMVEANTQVSILRVDRKRFYYAFPDAKLHFVQDVPSEAIKRLRNSRVSKKSYIGRDMVDGIRCRKYRIVEKTAKPVEGTVWVAPSLGNVPIRIEGIQGTERMTITLKNISTNTPPASLFDVPTNSVQKANAKELIAAARENWAQRLIDMEKQRRK